MLGDRFDQTGTTGQILFTATTGKITDKANARPRATSLTAIDEVTGVTLSNPLTADDPAAQQGRHRDARPGPLLADRSRPRPLSTPSLKAANAAGRSASRPPSAATPTRARADPSKVPELLGLLVSFLILAITFGSLLAAGMPITHRRSSASLVTLSSVVRGLPRRHGVEHRPDPGRDAGPGRRHRLRAVHPVALPPTAGRGTSRQPSRCRARSPPRAAPSCSPAPPSSSRWPACSVAQIPVLTVMGLGAAAAVAVAVLIALTLLPAIALLLGERLRRSAKERAAGCGGGAAPGRPRPTRPFAPLGAGRHRASRRDRPRASSVLLGLAAVPAASCGSPCRTTARHRRLAAARRPTTRSPPRSARATTRRSRSRRT